ncbi:ABC transporter substrate-binding protein [Patulibacter defluvii]|uniref:ABC transporter substrate-binding protein n=1 Tax=Patulibacter defluvii TaxID=3095358 RepID=UPI002A7554CB|nr:extracellular solute-binding protein [Patulibacter sp. DM4]
MRRLRHVAGLAAITALALAGCGGGGDSKADGPQTITLWHNSADPPALLQLYKDYEKQSGNTIELVKIPSAGFEDTTLTKWASGARPDVLEYHPTVTNLLALNPKATLRDLSDEAWVGKSGGLYETAATVDGKTYGAILGFPQIFGVFYNKQALKKAGVAVPTSFEQLQAACGRIKAAAPGVTPIAESGGSIWPPQILPSIYMGDANEGNRYGTALRTNKAKLDDAGSPFVAAMSAYAGLKDAGCFNKDLATATVERSVTQLAKGKAAMTALHSDMLPALLAAVGGDPAKLDATIGFFPLAAKTPAVTYIPSPIGSYYLPKTGNSGREQAALDFLRYATGKGYGRYVAAAKSFPVIEGTPDPKGVTALQQSFKTAYDKGPSNIAYAADVPGVGGVAKLMAKLMIGEITPKQIGEQTQKQVAQAAKAAKLPGW